jgi:RES domain-containing protein
VKTFWRISNFADLSGKGAEFASARWHTKGNRVVYLAESPAGAMLESLAHWLDNKGQLPQTYDLLEIAAPDELAVTELMPLAEVNWKDRMEFTRQLGDAWLLSSTTVFGRVPSVIVPYTWNVLLNPRHLDARSVRIESVTRERFDERLFRFEPH